MITADKLFQEEFTPAWQVAKRRAVEQSMTDAITAAVEFNYREMARETVRRISANHPPKYKLI